MVQPGYKPHFEWLNHRRPRTPGHQRRLLQDLRIQKAAAPAAFFRWKKGDVHGHLGKMMDVFEFPFTGSGNFVVVLAFQPQSFACRVGVAGVTSDVKSSIKHLQNPQGGAKFSLKIIGVDCHRC